MSKMPQIIQKAKSERFICCHEVLPYRISKFEKLQNIIISSSFISTNKIIK